MWMVPLAIGGTYASTSILFLKYPNLLPNFVKKRPGWYSRKPSWPKLCHISHRGGAGEFYENTFKAFQSSKEIGTQMLELDVHLTKDNVVVVSHDGNLKRLVLFMWLDIFYQRFCMYLNLEIIRLVFDRFQTVLIAKL